MKTNKVAGLLLAVSALASSSAMATVKTVTYVMAPVATGLTDILNANLGLQGFNPALGTLTSVSLNVSTNLSSSYVLNNKNASATRVVDTSLNATMLLTVPGDAVSYTAINNQSVYSVLGQSIVAGASFLSPTYTKTLTGTVLIDLTHNASDLSWFNSASTLALAAPVSLIATSSVASGRLIESIFTTYGNATGTVTYTYNEAAVAAVPEPETYGMLLAGIGMLGVVARRRKARSAQA